MEKIKNKIFYKDLRKARMGLIYGGLIGASYGSLFDLPSAVLGFLVGAVVGQVVNFNGLGTGSN